MTMCVSPALLSFTLFLTILISPALISPALAAPVSVGMVDFEVSTTDAHRTFDHLVLANIDGNPQIAGRDASGQLYRLTPSFNNVIVEPAQGMVMESEKQEKISFGGPIQGVPLQVMGESAGAQSMMFQDQGGTSQPYTLPTTEVFAPGTAQVIDLDKTDGVKEIAVVTLNQDNTSALSLFFNIQDRLARVMTLPQPNHPGLMDFVGLDTTHTPPVLITVQDPGGTSYLTFHQLMQGQPVTLGKFYGFSSVLPGTKIRPLTVLANADGEAGNEVISFRNDFKTLAFFQYGAQGLRLLRQQTFSNRVASGLTVLRNEKEDVTALGFMDEQANAILLIRKKGS
jgi:hypothetical protein